jgi:hypothetical protein
VKLKIFIALFALLQFISCKKDNESKPEFKGITLTDEQGSFMGFIDPTDWRTDDKFTKLEMQLFDTLNFNKVNQAKSASGIINKSIGTIIFYPNPTTDFGTLDIDHDNFILNMVMVDGEFNKVISYRATDRRSIAISFHSFNTGIYRVYYVLQDLQFNIIGLGHGDVKYE